MADTENKKKEEENEVIHPEELEEEIVFEDAVAENMQTPESSEEKKSDNKIKGDFTGSAKNWRPVDRAAPVMTDVGYIKERVDNQISYFNSKSSWNQKRYKNIKKWEIIISSVIPVVVSLSAMGVFQDWQFQYKYYLDLPSGGQQIKIVEWGLDTVLLTIAAFGGIVQVIFNKVIDLEEHHKLWKDYRATCEALQNQRLLYLTRTEPYDEEDAFPLFVDKVESILNNEQQKWRQRQPHQQSKQAAKEQQEENPLKKLQKGEK